MSANIFQTLFDVSIPDKINGNNNNELLIGGEPDAPPDAPPASQAPPPAQQSQSNKAVLSGYQIAKSKEHPDVKKEDSKGVPAANPEKPSAPPLPENSTKKSTKVIPTSSELPEPPKQELKIIDICGTNQILKRAILIIFIFTLATYLAAITLTVKPILEFVLGPNINLNINNNDDYIKKWFSISKLLLIYIAFIIIYVIGIILVITCIVAIFILFTGSDTVIEDTKVNILFYFWQFEEKSSIWYIYSILVAIILIAVFIFLYYHLYIKSYLENLSYPDMAQNSDSPEFTTPTKFIFYFGLYLSMMYLLYLLILTNALPGGSFLYTSIYIYIIMCIFMLFISIIYKSTLNRGRIEIPIATWFIFSLCIFIYVVLWEIMPRINMSGWIWFIVFALIITCFILISTIVIIVVLGFLENTSLNKERIELLVGPISGLIMINVIGLLIFLFVSIKD